MRDGQFRKIILRTSGTGGGSTAVRFYVNGSEVQNVTNNWIDTNTTGSVSYRYKLELDFIATFKAGDVIRVSVDPTSGLPGDIIFATEFVYTSS